MARFWIRHRKEHPRTGSGTCPVHLVGLALCVTILVVTVLEKFAEGGWLTLVITGGARRRLLLDQAPLRRSSSAPSARLDTRAARPRRTRAPRRRRASSDARGAPAATARLDRATPVAILFVGGYGGLGRHALLTLLRMFPGHFKGVVFVSVAVVDSDVFKGADEVERARGAHARAPRRATSASAGALGLAAASAYSRRAPRSRSRPRSSAIDLHRKYPKALVVAGQLIFEEDTLWTRILHNETAFIIQRRLQHAGVPMIVLPVRLDLERAQALRDGGSQAAA